jgi:uncharacterized RDD family membrane protein YckC
MASAEYSVLTPERVNLQYDIAGIGSRCAAVIVDSIIQIAALTLLTVALFASAAVSVAFAGVSGRGAGVLVIGLFGLAVLAITVGYFILFEIVWSGQTPGKRLVGVRVIRENGYPIRPVDAVIRNLVRIVDFLPASYGVGVLTMLLNKRSRRLGDFASGTIVVREGARGATSLVLHTDPDRMRGVTLSAADATLVRDFLTRRVTMEPGARAGLASRLATALSTRYGLSLEADAEEFLERLAA